MNVQLKKTALSALWLGFLIGLVGFVLNAIFGAWSARLAQGFSLIIVAGNVVFVLGCINLARAKGQPWYYGFLGLLSCVGLAILWFVVPDRAK
jgi:hypothetical protein